MSEQARITELTALDAFRASLLVYLERAGRLLDDVRQQVVSTRLWLQSDRQVYWKLEVRRRSAKLAQAEQELLSARLSGHPGAVQDRRMAVARARQDLEEAARSLEAVKSWLRRYETQVEVHLKVVTQLRQVLTHDLKKAVGFLERAASILGDYADLAREGGRLISEVGGASDASAASSVQPGGTP